MKRAPVKRLFLFLCFILAFQPISTTSVVEAKTAINWSPSEGPQISGGVISHLALDPNNGDHIFAIQEQSDLWQTISESYDAGDHWHSLSNLQNLWLHSLAIDPDQSNVLYLGSNTGIYRSVNGGVDWSQLTNFSSTISVPAANTIYSFERLPGTPDCTAGFDYFARSQDQGATWKKIPLGCGLNGEITSPFGHPLVIYLRLVDNSVSISQTLARSNDGGDSWSFFPLIGPLFSMGLFPIASDSAHPELLYSSSGTGIIISTDGGQTWNLKLSFSINGIFHFAFTAEEIYAGFESITGGAHGIILGAVYRSRDGGDTWEQLPLQLPSNLLALSVIPGIPDSILAGLDGHGVDRSTDGGQTWQFVNVGIMSSTKTFRLRIFPNSSHRAFAIIDWPRPALFTSPNDGLTWSISLDNVQLNDVLSDPQNVNTAWAIGPGGWIESQDGGNTWFSVNSLSGLYLAISPDAPGRPCATHFDQVEGYLVCRTLGQNGSEAWQSYPIPQSKGVSQIAISPTHGNWIFVGGTPDNQVSVIYQSTDGGNSWAESFRGPPNYMLDDLTISRDDPARIMAVFGEYHPDNLIIYESLDTGKTWHDLTLEMTKVVGDLWTGWTYQASVFFTPSGETYFASGDLIMVRPAFGQPWQILGMINDRIYASGFEDGLPHILWLAGEKGYWKTVLPQWYFIWFPNIFR